MTLKERIIQAVPTLKENDFGLKDDGEGVTFSFWDSNDPQPTVEQVRQWEAEVIENLKQNPPVSELEQLKKQQADLTFQLMLSGVL